ncbi:MAG TPA: outer membrane beta-barrel protein [Alphaproteobacteria bacterium]
MAVFCLLAAAPSGARAEDGVPADPVPATVTEQDNRNAGRGEDVLERFRNELPPAGARVGSFIFHPKVGAGLTYDDNIYATPSDEQSDLIGTLNLGGRIDSDLPRHAVGARANLDVNRYLDHTSENNWQGELGTSGAYDLNKDTKLGADLSARRLVEPRDDPNDLGAPTPTIYHSYRGVTSLQNTSGPLFSRLETGVERLEYDDIQSPLGTIPASERDRYEPFVGGTFSYRYLGSQQLYLRAQANQRNYDTEVDSSGFRRESNGYRAEVGGTADLGGLVFADVSVGYQQQAYDDDRFGTPSSPIGSVNLLWNPDRVTSVRLESTYEFAESFDTGSPGYWRSLTTLRVAHEITYDLLAIGRLVYQDRDFESLSRDDQIYGWDAGVSYRIDRGLFLDAEYRHREQESSAPTSDYERNLVLLQIRRTF